MKAIVFAGDLVREMGLVTRVVSRKAVIPTLTSVLMEYVLGRLLLSGTDTELIVRTSLAASAGEPGQALLPAQRLHDLARTLPPETEVTIEAADGVAGGSFSARGFKAKLQGYPVADYPALAPIPDGDPVWLSRASVAAAILRTRFATTDGDKRYFLDGAKLELTASAMRLIATDGHRLAVAETPRPAGVDVSALVPRRALDLLESLAERGETEVAFKQDERKLYFEIGDRLLVASRIEGNFPKYDRIIPKPIPAAKVDRPALLAALKRACMVTDQASRRVTLTLSAAGLAVSGKSAEVGEADEPVEATFDGSQVQTVANGAYLMEFADAVEAPTLDLQVKDDVSPIVWGSEEEGISCTYVVMPMRV